MIAGIEISELPLSFTVPVFLAGAMGMYLALERSAKHGASPLVHLLLAACYWAPTTALPLSQLGGDMTIVVFAVLPTLGVGFLEASAFKLWLVCKGCIDPDDMP